MLLILSNSQDATADHLESVVKGRLDYWRFDTDTLLPRLSLDYEAGRPILSFDGICCTPEEVSVLWYRRPERLKHPNIGDSPEENFLLEEWTEALEGFLAHIHHSKWINHPAQNVAASHKLEQLSRARALGLTVPNTLITQDPMRLREFHARHRGRIIAKPMATGYIERAGDATDSLIYTNHVLSPHLEQLDDLHSCPTLFQQLVEKRCDVRIVVVDDDLHAVALRAEEGGAQRCDIRRNNMLDVIYRRIVPPDIVALRLKELMASYQLRFAAIDMAVDRDGNWIFFEVNPNGQWAWLDLEGVTNIASSFLTAFSKSTTP